jgi:transmembrane protein 41 homolog
MDKKERSEEYYRENVAESKRYLFIDINSSRQVSFILASLLICSLIVLNQIWKKFPELEGADKAHLKVPWNEEDARNLAFVLSKYTDKHYYTVLFGILVLYIFLQSFAIPGSILLSVISGYLFSLPIALFLVCLVSLSFKCVFILYCKNLISN